MTQQPLTHEQSTHVRLAPDVGKTDVGKTTVPPIQASITRPRDATPSAPFLPQPWLRQGHIQTLLSRVKPRQLATKAGQPILIDGGPDYCDQAVLESSPRNVQLLGYFTPHAEQKIQSGDKDVLDQHRGLVMLLHGWEGCSHSNYNLGMTGVLTNAGFDVLSLNLRDHGPGLHLNPHLLNPGIFLGVLIDEVAHATQQIANLAGAAPFYIVGASMGGNFALRLANQHSVTPFANLRKVIAINPAVDPAHATDQVDTYPFYRQYFRRRWLNSLQAKQQLYPHLYNFDELVEISSIRAMTEWMIKRYGQRFVGFPSTTGEHKPFDSADEYFAAYAVRPSTVESLTVETEIISAWDDPIINAEDIHRLPAHPLLSRQLHPTGGHVGYVDLCPVHHYLPQLVLRSLLT